MIKQIRNSDWLDQHELTRRLPLALSKSIILKGIIGKKLLELNNGVLLSSHVSMQPYALKDYYDDLYRDLGTYYSRSSFDRRR